MPNHFNTLDVIPDLTDVARGKVSGNIPFGGYGEKTTSGADSGVLWPDGVYAFPPAIGVQISIKSTSPNDTSGGSGANSVDVHYLDSNLVERVETIVCTGTTAALSVATNIRFIQCMHLVTYGVGKCAAGTISATNGSNIYSQIYVGQLRCSSSVRMVPKNKRLLVTSMTGGAISGTAGSKVIIRISTPTFDGHDFTTDAVFMPLFSAAFQDTSTGLTIPCPLKFTEGQSVGMTFECDKAATVVGSWFGALENI